MKKIFYALVILLFVSCAQTASACSQTEGSITGSACSIKNLYNLEKQSAVQKRAGFLSNEEKGEKNLRPINKTPIIQKSDDDCFFGMCLYRQVIEKLNK